MGQYTNKGLYNKYDKNHKERNKVDYYATPPGETLNILNQFLPNFHQKIILEPCAGGGHMLEDIYEYCYEKEFDTKIIATDLHTHQTVNDYPILTGEKYDFLSDEYEVGPVDWIIMNPPYATLEPFIIRGLEIAKEGMIVLARLQFLEGKSRYENIFSKTPPNLIYTYVDRIQCWRGGVKPEGSSAQAYAWFIWKKQMLEKLPLYLNHTICRWIRRK